MKIRRIVASALVVAAGVVAVPGGVEATAGNCTSGTGWVSGYPTHVGHGTMWAKCTTGNSNDRWYVTWDCGLNGSTVNKVPVTIGAYAPSATKRTNRCPNNHSVVSSPFWVKYTV